MAIDLREEYDKIFRYCYIRVRDRHTAEDLTQETFLRYLERPHYHSGKKRSGCFTRSHATSASMNTADAALRISPRIFLRVQILRRAFWRASPFNKLSQNCPMRTESCCSCGM